MFQLLFERSTDPIWLFDPVAGVFLDCNQAAVDLFGSGTRERLLRARPSDLAPATQPDGRSSMAVAVEIAALVERNGGHRFEWVGRTADGRDVPCEVVATSIPVNGRPLHVVVSRDITARKQAEDEIRMLNATLESRVGERTAELAASEERSRTLIEHAPEAIVVFDGGTGRFLECNENAVRLYGFCREQLIGKHPAEVSPLVQPDGRPSVEAAREKIQLAIEGGTPVFDWMHQHSSGRLVPCEVRLVRMPDKGRVLLRGSVTDNTERQRREKIQQATFEIAESVHTVEDLDSLYRRIHSVIKGLMSADNFYIALFDPATEMVSFPYYVDEFGGWPAPFKVSTGLTGYVLRTGEVLLMNSEMESRKRVENGVVTFEGFPGISYEETGRPAAIWLGVPLSVGGQPIGVMAVQDYRNDQAYGPEDKQILGFVAKQTALAIARKRAEQELMRRAEQNRRHRKALLELALLDKADFQPAIESICGRSAEALSVARVSYWSLQDQGHALVCESLFLLRDCCVERGAAGTRLTAAECPIYFSSLATRQPMVANAVDANPHTSELLESYLRPLGVTSMLDVPVWSNGLLAGVLCHEHIGPARAWTGEEIDFASSVANMVSLAIEAAQRARSEQALRESEQKFRALFEASSQGVMLHDEERFLEVNPATLRILGLSRPEEIVGTHPAETAPPVQPDGEDSAVASRRRIAECMETGTSRFEWVTYNARREEVPMDVTLTRVEMGGRRIIQAVIQDISERKRAEAELLRALAREKELSALKSNFVSMVSHEFRTPLGVIMSSAEILGDYLEQLDTDERQRHLRSIARNTRRMSELMEEVLVLGRLDSGKMDFSPVPLDIAGLCARLVDEVMSATEGVCEVKFVAEDLPAEGAGDERLLRHIFLNLLTNAVKYSEPGGTVEFSVRREGRGAVCSVRDRGIGISAADIPALFHAFRRGCNVGQRPGTGLGLVIVKRCIELHGGEIAVESTVGEGTTMTVRVPVFPA